MRLSYLRYVLKTATDPQKLFDHESHELRRLESTSRPREGFHPLWGVTPLGLAQTTLT